MKSCEKCKNLFAARFEECPHCVADRHAKRAGVAAIAVATVCFFGLGAAIAYYSNSPDAPSTESDQDAADGAAITRASEVLDKALHEPANVRLMECMGAKVQDDQYPPSPDECSVLLARESIQESAARQAINDAMNNGGH